VILRTTKPHDSPRLAWFQRHRKGARILRPAYVADRLSGVEASAIAAHYGASDIVFSLETPVDGNPASPGNGVHVAFQAPDRETVRRFHAMALEHGGQDEGAPGIRANYNANYYGAFVLLDGIEFKQTAYALDRDSRKAAFARFLKRASDGEPEEGEEERRLAALVPASSLSCSLKRPGCAS
jgi:hypothetical protein